MSRNYISLDWNFDPLINMDLIRFQKRMTVIPTTEINSIFFEKLYNAELKLILAEAFYSPPGFVSQTHVDGVTQDFTEHWASRCKINWTNASSALTQWYDILPKNRYKVSASTAIDTNFINYTSVPKTLIEEAHISGWHIFEAGVPHMVSNISTEHRWCLSFVICPVEQTNNWSTVEIISEKLKINARLV